MNISHELITDNKLYKETYEFWVNCDYHKIRIILNSIIISERETTKHKFKEVKSWDRLRNSNNNTLKFEEIHNLIFGEKTDEIKNNVLKQVKDKIVFDSI